MTDTFNIYCDESCHLENDRHKAMVLGAVWCPLDKTREIAVRLREIKQKHGLSTRFEVKWTKVSPAKKAFYLDLVDYFFADRKEFLLPWTAFVITRDHTRRKLAKEYETFWNIRPRKG